MKLFELFGVSEAQEKTGTYAAVKFDKDTVDNLLTFIKENDIPNGLAAAKLHSTVLYSREDCSDIESLGTLEEPWIGTPIKFEVWGDDTKCLVLTFKCKEMIDRHQYFMDNGGTHDFDEYTPHVTLSYDIGDFDISELEVPDFDLVITSEYMEPLELDWVDNKDSEDDEEEDEENKEK